jgi:hypothetical protein
MKNITKYSFDIAFYMLRPSKKQCQRNILVSFSFGAACGAVMFAVATDTTISCCLGRQYGPLFRPSFLDAYD